MRIAITGAAGMLAAATRPLLESARHEVLALPRAAADVTDRDALIAAIRPFRPDWIFHFAAFTKVDLCEEREDEAMRVNGLGSRNAALAAAACDAGLLALSTDYVFDGRASRPWREYDPAAPLSAYGRSKWAGEQAVREVWQRHTVVRTSWLFGAGGPNFVDAILDRARRGEPLSVVDDQRGSPTWTADLAASLLRLAERAEYGTFHCTNSGDCTWYELAGHAIARAGLAATIRRIRTEELGRPAPRPAYSVLDNSACERATGRRMPHWTDAVDRYLESRAA